MPFRKTQQTPLKNPQQIQAQESLGNDLEKIVAKKPFISLLFAAAVGVAVEQSSHLITKLSREKVLNYTSKIDLRKTLQQHAIDLLKSALLMYLAQSSYNHGSSSNNSNKDIEVK